MAKAKHSSRAIVVRAPRAPTPIIRVSAPRAAPKKHHRRGHGKGGSTQKRMMGMAIGGAALGYIDKHFPNLPTIPVLGKAGTIAVAGYFFGKGKSGLLSDIALAAAAVAGYEFGGTGKIAGDDISGLAAQV